MIVLSGFLKKIHIIRHGDRLRIKLKNTMKEYQECSNSITGQTGLLIEIFFWNIMQRVSQLLVSFMIFMAVGEGVNKAVDVSVIQCFVAMAPIVCLYPVLWAWLIIL